MSDNLCHFQGARNLHEFCHARLSLVPVVENDAIQTPEHVFKMEAKFGVYFEPTLEVRPQLGFPHNLAISTSE
jgi:hypothetical protein